MHRNDLKSLLQKYNPIAAEERAYKQQMLDFLACCPDCFERSCNVGHFTASGWLLNSASTKCLLLLHTKLDQWFQLGGHCDGDPNVLNVAIKEVQEESGIKQIEPVSADIFDIDMHLIPQYKEVAAHYHFDVRFLLQVKSSEEIIQNSESKELKWFDLNVYGLPTQQESILRMLRKCLFYTQNNLIVNV